MRIFARVVVLSAMVTFAPGPAIEAQLASRPAEEWIKTLDGPTRVASLKIDEVVAAIRLEPGHVVADIGAGSGLFVVSLARTVGPKGRVFAVEIDEGFFPGIVKRAADAGVGNVQTVLGTFTDPALPVKNIDAAFFHDVLHHVAGRAEYLKALAPYLSSTGRIIVVDYEGGQGPHRADATLQVPREQLSSWMAAIGFRQVDEVKLFTDKYVLVFGRSLR